MKSLFSLNLPKDLIPSAKSKDIPVKDWAGAVVFLFVRGNLLLIKRSEDMPSHSGQIAFVGGHKNSNETPTQTAAREFEEETGLSSSILDFVGILEPVKTASRSLIIPCVYQVDMDPEAFIKRLKSNGEWSEAILVPFKDIIQYDRWTFAKSIRIGEKNLIMFYPIMRNSYISSTGSAVKDHLLWGATAKMIWNFFKFYDLNVKSDSTKGES
ncbi:MAG: CoA pyrophosphatase [Bacteriovoracaceae bacterium]|nr:CoA pyrophosphatase [Bacteriovoracaceae bacterium]